ncbi:EAL domain-containing protein [Ectothiorhodospira variabilis]|uniref:bifunctional diguanylate cyclase/phosphodiesterase n=1 Tax=Ectothiorhodospira variabilis TaxID=505694 RepID=UPI001EFB846A|nr:EAL domain-containing protein [Ectothiorhodospira variabilis]MCG5494312.1 EAL domain-containing protein [Ectothiorhodospira variabilis]MCG5504079.1 EAL domain-containing protein [Ectothiorhodospira variabilis]MCG5507234.1 EAL domain-containing protein [Ectothiorhodospira variabilis]
MYQEAISQGFVSLKWKFLAIFGVLLLLLLATFALFSHYNLQQQYEGQRALEQTRALEQLEGLSQQSHAELLSLAHLVPALSGVREALQAGDVSQLEVAFRPLWASLQMDADLALAAFLDADGEVMLQSSVGVPSCEDCPKMRGAVDQVLATERPLVFTHCQGLCLTKAVAPILGEEGTLGAIVLGRTLGDLVLAFQGTSQLDIALIEDPEGKALPDGTLDLRPQSQGGQLVALTRQDVLRPLLEDKTLVQVKSTMERRGRREAVLGDRSFEMMPFDLPGTHSEDRVLAVVISDVTEARRQIAAARWQNLFIGLAGLMVFMLAVVALTRQPLARLRRVAGLLPLLAEHRFAAAREQLDLSHRRPRLPDELTLLERITLGLADRLEFLERDVQRKNRSLTEKMHELSVERERYELAAAGANDGLWDWNLDTDRIYFSPRWKAMLGCRDVDLGDSPEAWFVRVHPDDVASLRRDVKAHLEGRSDWLESDQRVLHEHDGYLWMRFRGLAVRDDEGVAHRMAGSMTDITEQRRIQERLRHDALHDGLTGLPNRTLFLDRLTQAIYRARRADFEFAVLFLDLDDFKTINDSLGHAMGDRVLVQAAERLRRLLRPGDTVARLGGDEFTVLLEDLPDEDEIHKVVQRIRDAMAEPIRAGDEELFITFSMGIAKSTDEDLRADELLRNADTAMYQAKSRARGGSAFFNTAMHTRAVERLNLENAMRRALEHNEFQLNYQPLVALETGRLVGFEALARWRSADGKAVPPDVFIPAAEHSGLILPLGRWVIRESVAQAARWHLERTAVGAPCLPVNVNVSGKQLRDPELVSVLAAALEHHQIPGACIKVELTESALIENAAQALEVMEGLKAIGVSLCIDDFGTGYSSLSQLRDFPFDVVKIDRSFVRRLSVDAGHAAIIQAVISIAGALDKIVVAEGIETVGQAAHLRELGCQVGQGYLFAPALAEGPARELVQSDRVYPLS